MATVRRNPVAEAGYSLIEMMMILAIMGVLSGMAVVSISGARPSAMGDGAMRVVLSQLNTARETAITKRRNMRITFPAANQIQIVQEVPPVPPSTTITTLALPAIYFEGSIQYVLVANLPDSPDAYCPTLSATCFPISTDGSPATEMKFKPDGTFVDQNGITLNGTVFIAVPGQSYVVGHSTSSVMSGRAITVQGSTGRVRGYRYDGSSTTAGIPWKPV
jgi:type II secretory pathway pseudopilin PulG